MSWNVYLLLELSAKYFAELDYGAEITRRINSFLEVKNIFLRFPPNYRFSVFLPFPWSNLLKQDFKRSRLTVKYVAFYESFEKSLVALAFHTYSRTMNIHDEKPKKT